MKILTPDDSRLWQVKTWTFIVSELLPAIYKNWDKKYQSRGYPAYSARQYTCLFCESEMKAINGLERWNGVIASTFLVRVVLIFWGADQSPAVHSDGSLSAQNGPVNPEIKDCKYRAKVRMTLHVFRSEKETRIVTQESLLQCKTSPEKSYTVDGKHNGGESKVCEEDK